MSVTVPGLGRGPSLPHGPGLPTGLPFNSPHSSFQQKNQQATHLTGAFFALFVGHLYFWLQLLLSWRMKSLPQPGAPWIRPLRLVLCSLCTILMVASILMGAEGRAWGGCSLGWVCCVLVWMPPPFSAPLQHSRQSDDPGLCCLGWDPTLSTYWLGGGR